MKMKTARRKNPSIKGLTMTSRIFDIIGCTVALLAIVEKLSAWAILGKRNMRKMRNVLVWNLSWLRKSRGSVYLRKRNLILCSERVSKDRYKSPDGEDKEKSNNTPNDGVSSLLSLILVVASEDQVSHDAYDDPENCKRDGDTDDEVPYVGSLCGNTVDVSQSLCRHDKRGKESGT
jgi:hypothetical protein